MPKINFCLRCHAVLEVQDITGKMYDVVRGNYIFVPSQGYEISFHDRFPYGDCNGLVIEIDQELVDEMQDALDNEPEELHPAIEERCNENLNSAFNNRRENQIWKDVKTDLHPLVEERCR